MKTRFSEKFYEALRMNSEFLNEKDVMLDKDKFMEILDEEIINYSKDTMAEIGMGIFTVIQKKKEQGVLSRDILDLILRLCRDLIEKSPESALEFTSRWEY